MRNKPAPLARKLQVINSVWRETWETVDGGFPNLKYLLIEISELQQWITESSHFPRLKCLVLRSCRKLREIPESIREILTLEKIEVDYRNKSLVKLAKQINEDQESYGNYGLHVCVTHPHEIRRNSLRTRRVSIPAKMIHELLRKGEDW
ncbi:hypothetical protein AAHA92_12901 [Salvia divinorum]|uniref:Disease resistance protein n=1 Tax=Salvia divinorum TaxID=28513 RepID=A0ABD1H6K6_SALDI